MINLGYSDYLLSTIKNSYEKEKYERKDSHIHASELYTFCPRRYILCQIIGKPIHSHRQIGLGEKVTYDIGRKIQQIIRERLGDIIIKEEADFELDVCGYKIVGHADFIVDRGGRSFIVEAKSIKPEDFDILETAMPSHSMQLKSYLWLAKKTKSSYIKECNLDTDKGSIIYMCKLQKWEPFKTFDVELTDSFNKYMNGVIKTLKEHSKNKEFLPNKLCKTGNEFMARNCPERNLCFERK